MTLTSTTPTSAYTLGGILSQEKTDDGTPFLLYDTLSSFGSMSFVNHMDKTLDKLLCFLRVMDQIISIASVNESMGFFVGDDPAPINIGVKNVMKILTNVVYKKFMREADFSKFVKNELIRLSSGSGHESIIKEIRKYKSDDIKLDLALSPTLQFISSFLAHIWGVMLNETTEELGLSFGAPNVYEERVIHSYVMTSPHPDNADQFIISITTGVDGAPVPIIYPQNKKKQNKKKRRRRRK